MEIRVNVPDELATQAQARGVAVEAYVEELLSKQVSVAAATGKLSWTSEQVRAWLDSLAQFSDKIPPLPGAISREWIYEDHD
jgi:post-segregation antitoxin (ccd killing protein)